MQVRTDGPVGVLEPRASALRMVRYLPSEDLIHLVEHYWVVAWDLRGRPPHTQENLPHSSVHLAFESQGPLVYGVVRTKFTRVLTGQDWVFGVRFKPGAFRRFLRHPVSQLTDKVVDARHVFGPHIQSVHATLRGATDDQTLVREAEGFLRREQTAEDPSATLAAELVDRIVADRDILKVEDLADRCRRSPRALQRLFGEYVGVSPKWVIKRARLHEAIDRIAAGEVSSWVDLAGELGYFDQAHFIRDFKAVAGKTPADYARVSQARASA